MCDHNGNDGRQWLMHATQHSMGKHLKTIINKNPQCIVFKFVGILGRRQKGGVQEFVE